jgi:medium-chain acyl-[acyl-carrier-protein] hydrolase
MQSSIQAGVLPFPALAKRQEYAIVCALKETGMEKVRYLKDAYTVRFYEVDTQRRVTVQTICNYLQETADNHAVLLGFAVDQLQTQGMTWVLSRLHLKMDRYPHWRDTVHVATWPSDVRRLFAFRDYELRDEHDEVIGRATSDWLLLDINTLKPMPIPPSIVDNCNRERERVFTAPPVKLPDLERVEYETIFQVRQSDLDINRHVNNVNYVEWALETVPENVRETHQLSELQVVFRAASVYGDQIISQSCLVEEDGHKAYLHHLQRKGDEKTLTNIKSVWTSGLRE